MSNQSSTFTLTIQLGNAAMADVFDVAGALRTIADEMDERGYSATDGRVRDTNGNTVGEWVVA